MRRGFMRQLQLRKTRRKKRRILIIGFIVLLAIIDVAKYYSYGVIAITLLVMTAKKERKGRLSQEIQRNAYCLGKKERIRNNVILVLGSIFSYLMARSCFILLILPYISGLLLRLLNPNVVNKKRI